LDRVGAGERYHKTKIRRRLGPVGRDLSRIGTAGRRLKDFALRLMHQGLRAARGTGGSSLNLASWSGVSRKRAS